MVAINKKGTISNGVAIAGVLGLAFVGYVYYDNHSDSSNDGLNIQSDSVSNPGFYVSSLSATNTSVFTVTTSGTGNAIEYLIEVDADTLGNTARTETFTVGTTTNIDTSKPYDDNYRFAQQVFVPIKSDYTMKDTSDVSHVLMSYSSSTYDSKKGYQTISHQGVTEVQKTLSISFNPNSADLGTLTLINDVGESHAFDWDFGQSNVVKFKIKE